MKKLIQIFALIGAISLLSTCEVPFVGLGSYINLDYPVISNLPEGVQPGSYLFGNSNIVYLEVIQEFGIDYVFMTIWYTDYSGQERRRVIPVKFDDAKKSYYADIDTAGMADGTIKAQVTAVDADGKSTTTTDIIYIVKNNPPQIEMSLPAIKGDEYDASSMNSELEPIFMGNDIMGMASDLFGIEKGYPQILFWPANYTGTVDSTGAPLPSDSKWGKWRTMTDDRYRILDKDELKSVQFRWPLVELEEKPDGTWELPDIANNAHFMELQAGRYRFKVRVTDKLGVLNTYPNRVDNSHGFTQTDGRLNQYIEISIVSPSGPVVRLQNVPQYYNGAHPFEATMIITSSSHVDTVRAGVSNNENTAAVQWVNATRIEGNLYSVSVPYEKMPDTQGAGTGVKTGDKVLHVEAEDDSGITNDSRSFILDNLPPDLEFLEPAGMGTSNLPQVTSTVIFRGITNDNTRVARLYYALGRTETNSSNINLEETPMDMEAHTLNPGRGWIDALLHTGNPIITHPGQGNIHAAWGGSQSSWTLRFEDIADLCRFPSPAAGSNGNYYVSDYDWQNNLWTLPIYFKAVDVAGNVRIYKESVIVDPDADSPVIEIRSHEGEQTVGGSVRVNGTAKDNEMIYSVEVRVYMQGDADCDTVLTPSIPVTNDFVPVNIVGSMGSTVSWFYNINQDGSLNPPVGKTSRRVTLEFRAADASIYNPNVFKHYGGVKELTLKIDNTVPIIENETVIRGKPSQEGSVPIQPYVFGSRVSGFVTLKAVVRGQDGISGILMNLQGTSNYIELLGTSPNDAAAYMTPPVPVGSEGYYESEVYIPLNTEEILNGMYLNSAGSYEIAAQVSDGKATPYTAHKTFTLHIDNYSPLASYNGYLNAAASAYSISGSAWDIANHISIQGIEMIVVYFSRAGSGVPLNEKAGTPASWVNDQKAKQNRKGDISSVTEEGQIITLPFFPDVRQSNGTYVTTGSGIVIKESGYSGSYFTTFTGNPVREWSASFDPNQLEDGPVTLNYVVFDSAGNASHFAQDIYIANNRPLITSFALGTDILANGSAQFSPYNVSNQEEITTNFRIRNNLFSVNIETMFGNGNKRYRVFYASRSGPVSASAIIKGNVYTIAEPGNIEWVNYGVFEKPQGNFYNGITFVATTNYLGSGDGTVYSYTQTGNANTVRTGNLAGDIAQNINFQGASFGAAPLITDSVLAADANGNAILNHNRYFVIKVYDTTVTGAAESGQLSQAIVINADVNNSDIIKPRIAITPFFWNNAASNSLYLNSKDMGHIELESDLDAAVFNQANGIRDRDPKVSGAISIRGSAFDDNTVGNIYFKIDGFTDSGAAAGSASAAGYYRAAAYSNGLLSGIDRFDSAGWRLSITNVTHNQSGHSVQWQLDFDSARVAGVASLDTAIKVIAADRNPNYSDSSNTQTSAALPTPHYRVDITPYISGIETNDRLAGGLKSNNIRSADGKYSILQGNNAGFITVRGFNLNPSNARILNEDGNNDFKKNPSSVPAGTANISFNGGASPYTVITMTNNVSRSGYLTLTVNGIGNLNNINNNDAKGSYTPGTSAIDEAQMPNRKADPYITKNNTLTDDVYLQFYTVKKTDAANGYYPVMLMEEKEGKDVVVFAYVNDTGGLNGGAALGANMNAGVYMPVDAKAQRTKFTIDGAARLDTEFLIKNFTTQQMGMARDESGRYIHAVNHDVNQSHFHLVYDRFAELHGAASTGSPSNSDSSLGSAYGSGIRWSTYQSPNNAFAHNEYNNAITLESSNFLIEPVNTLVTLDRYQYPKLIAKGDSVESYAYYYMIYYDAAFRQIMFRNFRIGKWEYVNQGEPDSNKSQRGLLQPVNPNIGLRSSQAVEGLCVDSRERPYNSYTNLGAFQIITYLNSAYQGDRKRMLAASGTGVTNYYDMAVDSNDRAVIVYYNESVSKLVIKYSGALDGTTGGDERYSGSDTYAGSPLFTFTDSSANEQMPSYVGPYVSMTIDDQDRLHIAAFDLSASDLCYILVENFAGSANVTSARVDQYGSAGFWTDIKVRDNTPYIAYYNSVETGTREAVKIAWAKNMVTDAASVKSGVDSEGYTTGNWEYRTVPTVDPTPGSDPRFQKVNLQFRLNGDPVLGYLGSNIEFSYPAGE